MSFTRSYKHASFLSGRLRCCQSQLTTHCNPAALSIPASSLLSIFSSQFSTTSACNGVTKPTYDRNARRRQRKKELDQEIDTMQDLFDILEHRRVPSKTETSEGPAGDQDEELEDEHEHEQGRLEAFLPSDRLPRSMIELRLSTKQRYQERKKRAMLEKTNKNPLAYNPYAQALASPMRSCHATGVRLPSAFLTGFGLVQHPETKNLWFIPTSLMKDELGIGKHIEDEGGARRSTKYIPPVYMSMTSTLHKTLSKMSTKHLGKWLMPLRWKVPFGSVTKTQERNAVWREDMQDFILKQLQMRLVNAFLKSHLYIKQPTQEVKRTGNVALDLGAAGGVEKLQEALNALKWVDADAVLEESETPDTRNWGAVIILRNAGIAPDPVEILEGQTAGSPSESTLALGHQSASISQETPPASNPSADSYTFPDIIRPSFTRSDIPLFDLSKLLTEEQLETLRTRGHNKEVFSSSGAFFMQPAQASLMRILSALWQIRCYVGVEN